MTADRRIKDMMFRAQRDAGGNFSINVLDGVPQGEIWFIGEKGHLMTKMSFPYPVTPEKVPEFAAALAEAVDFVSKKRREPVCSFWLNELHVDDFKAVLAEYEEEPIEASEPEQEYVDNGTG